MRDEIEVSQLIGATAADVRRPFLYHGLLQGLAGGAGGRRARGPHRGLAERRAVSAHFVLCL